MASVPHASERVADVTALAAPTSVLWIDDEPELMSAHVKYLRRNGCQVEFVGDAAAGLDAARRQTHDVIILDWQMPRMSGTELLTRFRGEGYRTPVVILTGHGTEDIAFGLGQLGAVAYRTKPIGPAALLELIKAVVHQPVASKPFASPTCGRLAHAMVAVIDLADDPRTFEMWARVPEVTEDGLHRWCELLDVDGRDVLTFARILRAVVLVERHGVVFAEVLDVADAKTLQRLLARTGLSPDQAPSSVHVREFLAQQTLLTHTGLLRCIAELLLHRDGGKGGG